MASLLKNKLNQQLQQVRYLPRWNSRYPKRVIKPENYDKSTDSVHPAEGHLSNDENTLQSDKISWRRPLPVKSRAKINDHNKLRRETPLSIIQVTTVKPKQSLIEILESVIDNDGNVKYTKMENKDIRVSKLMATVKSKSIKEKKKLMLLEGKTLVKEALESRCKLEYILFSRMKEVEQLKDFLPKSGAKLYKMPYQEMQTWSDLTTTPGIMGIFKIPDSNKFEPRDPLPITVICDNVREPNNLGAILRICSGAGCEKVILAKGCVNVWETKVLRSASGAHFKLKIDNKVNMNDIKYCLPKNCHIFIADNKMECPGKYSENNLNHASSNIPVIPYFAIDFKTSEHIVLIIGGETEGISDSSYKMTEECNGVRLNIPLKNGLNSLNTGSALGIIVFEIKRQLTSLQNKSVEDYVTRRINENI